jgi:hypothetical protein
LTDALEDSERSGFYLATAGVDPDPDREGFYEWDAERGVYENAAGHTLPPDAAPDSGFEFNIEVKDE